MEAVFVENVNVNCKVPEGKGWFSEGSEKVSSEECTKDGDIIPGKVRKLI